MRTLGKTPETYQSWFHPCGPPTYTTQLIRFDRKLNKTNQLHNHDNDGDKSSTHHLLKIIPNS